MQEQRQITAAVIALAGRRIDAADAAMPRFPLDKIPVVRELLAELLVQEHAVALVCSAACGADLIALEEAERLGLRRRSCCRLPRSVSATVRCSIGPGIGDRCSIA